MKKNNLVILPFIIFSFCNFFAQSVLYKNGIVASVHELASKTGIEILKKGGNAVDAAVASAFVLSVVEPYASGIGGGGFLTIKMNNKNPVTIDYREKAPGNIRSEIYYSDSSKFELLTSVGAKAVGVPGVLKGLNMALQKYGSMNLAQVLEPAIKIANGGYTVSQTMYDIIIEQYGLISLFEETAKTYIPDGLPPDAGAKIINQDLAGTYEKIGKFGIEYFYNGELAEKITNTINNAGGIFSGDDLKKYEALIKEPILGNYKGYEIITSAPPSGGTHLIELLNILENFDLKKLGHYTADYIHVFSEAIKIIQADKSYYMGDPDFINIPVSNLISKQYGNETASNIKLDSVCTHWKPKFSIDSESGSTTSLSVIDKELNIVTITQSLNLFFGSGITVAGTGIILNNHLNNFEKSPGKINSIGPNKRPVSSIAPTIVLKNGKPFLTLGTPGGSRIIGILAQVLVNLIDFDMSLNDAIAAPRFHASNEKLQIESRISKEIIQELEKKGHKIEMYSAFDKYFGGVQGVMIDNKSNKFLGAADPRRGGSVEGY